MNDSSLIHAFFEFNGFCANSWCGRGAHAKGAELSNRDPLGDMKGGLENALECMKLDGALSKLYVKWFGVDPEPGSSTVTVYPGYGVPGMPGYDPTPHKPQC